MMRVFLAALVLFGCERKHEPEPSEPAPARDEARATTTFEGENAAADDRQAELCRERFAKLGALDAPVEDRRRRAETLARARAEPVVFLSEPVAVKPPSPVALHWRRRLETTDGLWDVFDRLIDRFVKEPSILREVILTDGYLYARSPELASLYANHLTLGLLFREPVLELTRGTETRRLVRSETGGYEYLDGPEKGKPARLLLFDRVFIEGDERGPSRHVDLRPLAMRFAADEIVLARSSETALGVELLYGSERVQAVLDRKGEKVELGCEALFDRQRDEVEARRQLHAREQRVQAALGEVIRQQVDEGLPFDEPKTEDGQQDGKLRPEWRWAYLHGRSRYEFNGDSYWVFDRNGRPHVPQVCIDFITDTFERASGTWWRERGAPRERVMGELDFDDFSLENKRSIEKFVEFARSHTEAFEVYSVPQEERVALMNRSRFFGDLYAKRATYRPGDVVVIYGLRDDEKLHYHSFFVYESDPVTGMPMLVASNAGRPRIRTWENEMQNAPRRSVLARIRPRLSWLETHVRMRQSVAASDPLTPPPG
jgi:hypothetical protein